MSGAVRALRRNGDLGPRRASRGAAQRRAAPRRRPRARRAGRARDAVRRRRAAGAARADRADDERPRPAGVSSDRTRSGDRHCRRSREGSRMSRLVRLYPQAWRDRYEDEFVDPARGAAADARRRARHDPRRDRRAPPSDGGRSEPAPWTHRLPGLLRAGRRACCGPASTCPSRSGARTRVRMGRRSCRSSCSRCSSASRATTWRHTAGRSRSGSALIRLEHRAHQRRRLERRRVGARRGRLPHRGLRDAGHWPPSGPGSGGAGDGCCSSARSFLPLVIVIRGQRARHYGTVVVIPEGSPAMYFLVLPYGLAWVLVGLRMTIRGSPTSSIRHRQPRRRRRRSSAA